MPGDSDVAGIARLASSSSKPAASAAPKPRAQPASSKPTPKYHVVKPDETLYRVAVNNGISVTKLRKLNQLGPNDNTIRVGQKLKVSG